MVAPLESLVVRIYSKSGKVVGAGFLVSSKYVLTCAHVVTDALGLARKTAEKPDLEISLDFPLLAAKQLFAAKVIFWRPENPNEQFEDIAGLELANSPPNTAKPALLVTSEDLWEHPFRVLGFPAGQPNGVSAAGVLRGRAANGWVQLEDVKQPGYRLEPGFSGAPVWDEKLQGVAGIAVAAEMNRPEVKAAFMIPANVLIAAWPELGKQVIAACPYRGLSAFREEDAEFFFGRETFVDGLVRVVQQQPLVAVIGSSGSGKSSVVLAGLIPKLREEGSWLIESFRPNKQPFYELAAALIGQLEPELGKTDKNIKAKELAESIRKYGFTADVSAILKDNPDKRLLLVVDQFEELYTGCADTVQQQFVDALLAAVESDSRTVTLVLTLRADFYSYVVNYPPFTEALNKYPAQNLTLMKAEEMQAAIELPAEKMNVKLEEKLTERILNDVKKEPGNLPLLEFALTQLWEKQSQGRLTHQAYSEIGGVTKALSNHAEAVYGKLSQGEQKQAQRIFLQLVRPGEGTEDTRRVATRGEVGNWELVTFLAGEDARLVVTGRNEAGEETVEVVHEALIREWGMLRQWIDENRKKLIQKREIEDAAKRWRDRGKGKDYLLGKKVLTQATVFQKEETGNVSVSDLGKEFIQKSLRQRRNERFSIGLYWIIIIILLSLVTLGGTIVVTQIKLRQLWAIVTREKSDSPVRIKALQDLVKLVKVNNNFGGMVRIDLSYVNLRNVDFSGVDLSHAILLNADLSGANFSGTILSRTNLINANLSGADLTDSDLTDASLSNTNLSNADLSGADLTDADLSHSNFFASNLSGANLSGANLSGADLKGTYFSNADLSGANLSDADLTGTDFSNADLSDANLSHVKFQKIAIVHSGERERLISKAEEESYLRLKQESESTDLGRGAPIRRNDIILKNKNVNLDNANLDNTNLRGAKNLTPEQVKSAKNWQQAIYDEEFRKKLGLK